MEHDPKKDAERPKLRPQHHSPQSLLRQPVALPGGLTLSAVNRKGRLMVRVDVSEDER